MKDRLLIATAANMQTPMQTIVEEFEEANNTKCTLAVASSGKLASQIQKGAPFDLFLSADTIYPYQLFEERLTIGTPTIYAYGALCLCSMRPDGDIEFTEDYLAAFDKLVIANPDVAPYGKASKEALERMYPDYGNHLVVAESIGQAALFIRTRSAELGILSKSMRKAIEESGGQCKELDQSLYAPIAQAVVVLKSSSQKEAALDFKHFLLSDRGKEILNKFGFSR
ncbi:MAG: molybdate ABC transporter substrate-binding protein [Bacteroidota bacterium]